MHKEDIYKYFKLDVELFNTIMNWIRDIRKNTQYNNLPYTIDKIINNGNGIILLKITYYLENGKNEVIDYSIPIEDLERY